MRTRLISKRIKVISRIIISCFAVGMLSWGLTASTLKVQADSAIQFGQSVYGSVQTVGKIDNYTFTGNSGDSIFIRMSQVSGLLNPQVRLFDSSGNDIAGNWGLKVAEVNYVLPAAGTYQIQASDYYGAQTGNYSLFVQRLNQAGNAVSLKIGDTISGSIGPPGKVDTYTLTARAGDEISIIANQTSGSLYPEIRLYYQDGTRLARSWSVKNTEISHILEKDGVYVILVDDYQGNLTGNYNLTGKLLSSGTPPATTPKPSPTTAPSVSPTSIPQTPPTSTLTKTTTPTSTTNPAPTTLLGKPFTFTINDPSGDVSRDFLDITQGSVTINGSNIIATMKLANIPDQLLFDKDANAVSWMEYQWSLYIDADNNPETGSVPRIAFSAPGCEYSLSVMHFKPQSSVGQRYDSLLKGTQHNIWRYDSSTVSWRTMESIQAVIDNNTLTMTAPLNAAISPSSKFYFVTYFHEGNVTEKDTAPNLQPATSAPQTAGSSDFADSIPLLSQLSTDPKVIGTNVLLAIITVLAFYLGATVFNSTVKENYKDIQGWLQRVSKVFRLLSPPGLNSGLAGYKSTVRDYLQGTLIVAICALIYWFLNPYFTNSLKGVALYISLAVGMSIATYAYDGTQLFMSRRAGVPAVIQIFPVAILIAVVCVVLSHIVHFRPGLIFGFIGAYTVLASSQKLSDNQEIEENKQHAKAILLGIWVILIICAIAFGLRELLHKLAWQEGTFWRYLIDDILIAATAIGLEGLVFLMVPLDFLDGKKVFKWHWWVWLITITATTFAFYWIIIHFDKKLPDAVKEANLLIMWVVIGLFLVISFGMWAYFRWRNKKRRRKETRVPTPEPPETVEAQEVTAGKEFVLSEKVEMKEVVDKPVPAPPEKAEIKEKTEFKASETAGRTEAEPVAKEQPVQLPEESNMQSGQEAANTEKRKPDSLK